ncbi:MAG: PIN domain-containing protein [Nanoarchaeota archaeon]
MKKYYVDSCIYLNLWQKETSQKTKAPFWRFAKEFFEEAQNNNATIYYSGYLLRELMFILSEKEFKQKRELFESSPNFKKIRLSQEEYQLARKIESNIEFEISFYDIIHMLLAKKTKSTLITRDRKLKEIATKYSVKIKLPEQAL